MSNSAPPAIGGACGQGLCGGKCKEILREGVWGNNPISIQILGVCSALAVTNKLENSIVMGVALIFVCAMSNLLVSLLRNATPRRIRMIAEVAIIATFVIVFDLFLKAFYFEMSKSLGPYVGLIITNCIVMGRAEAYALRNPPMMAVVDGVANGLGYAAVLVIIGFFRELIGSGKLLDIVVLSDNWYIPNQMMILAPGAFLALGFLIALANYIKPRQEEETK
ncbi:MAG: NADH:ubiquinone reductase (Na(+)-transporting) subunit D [Planctomycetes bacterium]|jgi:Na+-transporting NADH:ubiquinone oxidoreductase subunit D|nr:NADH:ubiquinone reductase (Na(+)-transporting) subunit D [Planctomycetota bacterium]